MDINGASAIVTGGASGIGAASARQLAARGARVVVADLQAAQGCGRSKTSLLDKAVIYLLDGDVLAA